MDFDAIITGIRKAIYGREVREYIASSMEWTRDFVNQSIANIKELLRQAEAARDSAKASQDAAKVSETNAKTSETNAKSSETKAATSEANAKTSETKAKASADSMGTSVATCTAKAKEAEASAGKAKTSEGNAKTSEGNAKASENEARQLVEAAKKVVNTDKTLTIDGAPADAKIVGDKFKSIKTDWNSVTDKPSTFPPSEHNHSKLAFENTNEVNFVGTPENNTVYWGCRGSTIDEYRFNDGRGSGAFANVRANKFIGSLDGGVTDYNNSDHVIKIGYSGDGLNTSNLTHIAGYTDNGTKIKGVSKAVLQSWLGVTTIRSQTSDPGAGSSLATGSILLVYA